MKKALLVTTVSGFVPQFEMNSVELLQENGYEVHYATNYNYPFYGSDNRRLDGTGIVRHQVDFSRSPYSKKTFVSYKQLCEIMKENDFDVLHCHTPMGGIIARLAAKKYSIPMVIYTAHGFHFFKGAPKVNWLVYYSAEKIMARYTDVLITINQEDLKNARKFKVKKNGKVYQLPGAGIDTNLYRDVHCDIKKKKTELGINENSFVILSIGELNDNKNHRIVIQALSKIEHSQITYLICGKGDGEQSLKDLIKELHMEETVKLLGFRKDIPEICKVSDLFVFPSYREGLPVSLMEAMASGLPVIASKIRGNEDLIKQGKNGYLVSPSEQEAWGKYILEMKDSEKKRKRMGENNQIEMIKYDKKQVKMKLEEIYKKHFL